MRSAGLVVVVFALAACDGAVAPTNTPPQARQTMPASSSTAGPLPSPSAASSPAASQVALSGLIVFQRTGDGVFTVDPNGVGERKILSAEYETPRWSPSGKLLALSHTLDDEHGIVVPAIANPDGSGAHDVPLLREGLHCGAPVWSPDGIWLAAECWDESHPANTGVYVLRAADGRRLRQLTIGHSIPGGFSRDGGRLVFTDDDGRLGIVDVASADVRLIGVEAVGAYPGFMPDGRAVFASIAGIIAIIDLDGNVVQRVRAPEARMSEPRLGPDGANFVFTYDPAAVGTPGLARIGVDGQGFADILLGTPGGGEDVAADWRR